MSEDEDDPDALDAKLSLTGRYQINLVKSYETNQVDDSKLLENIIAESNEEFLLNFK